MFGIIFNETTHLQDVLQEVKATDPKTLDTGIASQLAAFGWSESPYRPDTLSEVNWQYYCVLSLWMQLFSKLPTITEPKASTGLQEVDKLLLKPMIV